MIFIAKFFSRQNVTNVVLFNKNKDCIIFRANLVKLTRQSFDFSNIVRFIHDQWLKWYEIGGGSLFQRFGQDSQPGEGEGCKSKMFRASGSHLIAFLAAESVF